jgi:8-oxo-dGTP pyrophosphatase MutT (NUDIX family)
VITLDDVRAALALDDFDVDDARRQMAPVPRSLQRSSQRAGKPRRAAVLILLYPLDDGLGLVCIQRTKNHRDVHSGQIGLPGGAQEPGETPQQTALRETHEEIGVAGPIHMLGRLDPLYIPPSDFEVHPFVGHIDPAPTWVPDPAEVVKVIAWPLAWLLDEQRKVIEDWEMGGYTLRVPWYNIVGQQVWGATAILLGELEQRLRRVLRSRCS